MGQKHKVVVVGASVAGLFAAYKLARAGVPVQVYEAQGTFAPAALAWNGSPSCRPRWPCRRTWRQTPCGSGSTGRARASSTG